LKDKFNPPEILSIIQKLKYKAAAGPIVIIVLSFVIHLLTKADFTKYIAVFGVLLFYLILIKYKVKKILPNTDDNAIISPLNGKIIKVENGEIVLKKGGFQSAEIRYPANFKVKYNFFAKRIFLIDVESRVQGQLIGAAPYITGCSIKIPADFKIIVSVGDSVNSGETILANRKTNEEL
jgi:hypothetical protein